MTQRVLVYRIAAAGAALVLLAACGDDKKDEATSQPPAATSTPDAGSSSTEPTTEASAQSSSGSSADATTVDIDLSEFMVHLDKTTLAAGTYTFKATNSGSIPHAFQIDGPGVEDKGTGTIQPGDEGTVTVTLQKGTYTFYCPVPGHEDKGMKQEVTVT
ncbi:MAG TPA: cupredoxin domain-containing protein [Sporichthya sp.]|nr:cupredoxin domain-containing protein [Sporichthya sp.]